MRLVYLLVGPTSITGTGAASLAPVSGSAAGSLKVVGSGSGSLGRIAGAGVGSIRILGSVAASLGLIFGAGLGSLRITGVGAGSLKAIITQYRPLPYDLAEAIVARFADLAATTLGDLTGIHHDAAGTGDLPPYLVFKIPSASIEFYSSDSQWDDTRVRFEVMAATQDQANRLRDLVAKGYLGRSLDFTTGIATPFVRVDRAESRERSRTVDNKLLFKSLAVFQTRVRLD